MGKGLEVSAPEFVLHEGVYYRAEPSTSCEEVKVAIQALFKFN